MVDDFESKPGTGLEKIQEFIPGNIIDQGLIDRLGGTKMTPQANQWGKAEEISRSDDSNDELMTVRVGLGKFDDTFTDKVEARGRLSFPEDYFMLPVGFTDRQSLPARKFPRFKMGQDASVNATAFRTYSNGIFRIGVLEKLIFSSAGTHNLLPHPLQCKDALGVNSYGNIKQIVSKAWKSLAKHLISEFCRL